MLKVCVAACTLSTLLILPAAASEVPPLVINEVMSNPDPLAGDPYGFEGEEQVGFVVSDWVEIHNAGDMRGGVDVDDGPILRLARDRSFGERDPSRSGNAADRSHECDQSG